MSPRFRIRVAALPGHPGAGSISNGTADLKFLLSKDYIDDRERT
jgi:hypothetical protein